MVQLAVTPVYYPEYRAWLVGPFKLRVTIQLTLKLKVLEVIYQQLEVEMTSCEGCLLFIVYIRERKLTTSGILCNFNCCK